jgi:hypothetical protein
MTDRTIPASVDYIAGPLDSWVWDLESRVNGVRKEWLNSDESNEADRAAVRRSALRNAQALASVPENKLGLGGVIVKSEYACFAFVIAAANGTSNQDQLSFARRAEVYCRDASLNLHKATDPSSKDQNSKAVAKWASTSEEQPRIDYLLAMSECLQATSSGSERLKEESIKIITTQIPTYYLDRYPPARDIVLNHCIGR